MAAAAVNDFVQAMQRKDITAAREIAAQVVERDSGELLGGIRKAVRVLRESKLNDDPTLPELVELVDSYRASGDDNSRLLTELLIQAKCGPQKIAGTGGIVRR